MRVHWKTENNHAAICVADRGVGIPPSEQQAIFRKFVRGRSAIDANIKGTGVDCRWCRKSLSRMAGKSGWRARSSVAVYLRWCSHCTSVEFLCDEILVVEDEPGIALALEDDLTLEGYQVEVIGDGLAAAKKAREQPYDAILLDVMLPGKDGFEVCRELRRNGIRTPILMLTARAQEAEKVLGLEAGADDYVTKPFSARELRARIAALLRREPGRFCSAPGACR